MSLLSHQEILHEILTRQIVEGADTANINSASLDIRLGKHILVESNANTVKATGYDPQILSLKERTPLTTVQVDLESQGKFILHPGQFILAQSLEIFHLPLDISAEYKLKSSMARVGLEHLNAGWCDAGWNGSVLTLELRNLTTYHQIELRYGDKIGQIIFFRHHPVDFDNSYAAIGTYNGDKTVSTSKPLVQFEGRECDACQS